MDLSRGEAAALLKKGDISFLLGAEPKRMKELARLDPSAPFYAGLLVQAAGGGNGRAEILYETALESPSPRIRRETALKLSTLMLEKRDTELAERVVSRIRKLKTDEGVFVTLEASALYVLERYPEVLARLRPVKEPSSWDRAFLIMAELQLPGAELQQTTLRDFFFNPPEEHSPRSRDYPQALRWVSEELGLGTGQIVFPLVNTLLPPGDAAALAGRLALSMQAYSEALAHFETVIKTDKNLFFQYPSLLNDLGRTYQSIPSRREAGLKLFAEWDTAKNSGLRYTLLFYSGRIRRAQGKNADAADFFTRALVHAPDKAQEDACIWYIINCTLNEKPENTPGLIKTYAPIWNDDNAFYDLLDRLSCYLTRNSKWGDVRDVLSQIRNGTDGATIAKYAYITGRAVSEGYISGRDLSAQDYFTIAYEEGNASFYYRALGASYLGKTVVPLKTQASHEGKTKVSKSGDLEFYQNFFVYGAGQYAYAYLREDLDNFSAPEMRVLAKIFAGEGRYLESIQITGVFMRREDYQMERADLELYYPRPFTALIEKNARDNMVKIPVFFGLVRTESAFIPDIASHAGAVGLAQIMPATAKEVAASIKRQGGPDFAATGTIDLIDPEVNVYMGAFYLKQLTDSMGSPMLALLAYNGGPSRIRRLRRQAPSLPEDIFLETIDVTETRNYGKRVMAAAAAYGYLYYGMSMDQVVADIFK
jgi:soluble lytic murein transglycosylase